MLKTPPYHQGHPRRNTRQSDRGRVLVSSSARLGTADFSANEERGISMQRQRIRRAAVGLPVVAMALVLAACSSSTTTGGSSSGGGSSLSGTLNGSGSTFQLTFQQSAIQAFKTVQPNMTVNYGGGGSGKGRSDLAAGVVNYAGSDSPIPSDEVANFKGKTVLYFPVMLGPITMSYNLSGVSNLKLDMPTIASIFQGKIKTWNFSLPLTLGTASNWMLATSSTINWPSTAHGGNGNGGVAQIVKTTPGAIGYVDYADAKAAGLTFASVKNQAGSFIA